MDYLKPAEVVENMINTGAAKGALPVKDLLIRGFLSGSVLGFATSLACNATAQTHLPLIGALVFPVGFIIVVLLGFELATGSFALLPLAWKENRLSAAQMCANLGWVLLGNLLGSLFYAALISIALTSAGHVSDNETALKIIAVAESKTIAYAKFGVAGLLTAFIKGVLCNWMVCTAVVLAMTSTSTIGKIVAAWIPVFIFYAQSFEHSVVNMFVIPAGIMMGARVSIADWLLWNQIPVTIANAIGGFVFTGLALYLTHRGGEKKAAAVPASAPDDGNLTPEALAQVSL